LTCSALQYSVDHRDVPLPCLQEGRDVLDIFFLAVTVIFFVGCLAYIVGCEQL
jgi:hypothetical protein